MKLIYSGGEVFKNLMSLLKKVFKNEESLIKFCSTKQSYKVPPLVFPKAFYNITEKYFNNTLYYVISTKKKTPPNKSLLYVHGGAFVIEINIIHWLHIKALVDKTNAEIYVPIYHLTTPEYSNQIDTVNFILKIYKKMLETYTPDKITVFGDSAGGNLIMAALAQLRDNKLPNPKNIILSSPFFTYEQYEEDKILLNNDPILPEIFFTVVNKWQLGKNDVKNTYFSPYFAKPDFIENLYIFCGTDELFSISIKRYCKEVLDKNDVKYTLICEKNMFHDYATFISFKEAKNAVKKMVSVINN